MKKLYFFLLLITTTAFSQTASDTLFLLKKKGHRVYVENNPSAVAYKDVLSFAVDRDGTTYNQSVDYLNKKYKTSATRFTTQGISGKWYPLYLHNGTYYLYSPCDFIYHHSFAIAFDGVTDLTPEGYAVNRLLNYTKTGNSHTLQLDGSFNGEFTRTIHIIDAERGIAVIEEKRGNGLPEYYLAVHSVTAANFPIIVNDCKGEKQSEYEFAEPDYKALLKNRK